MNKKFPEPIASAVKETCTRSSAAQVPWPRLHSKELFGTVHKIVIEHVGDEYRLPVQCRQLNFPHPALSLSLRDENADNEMQRILRRFPRMNIPKLRRIFVHFLRCKRGA